MDNRIPWNITDLLDATGGNLVFGSGSISFQGVSIDTRTIDPADLYVALRGLNHDGHDFIPDAAAKGCRGFVVDRDKAASLPFDRAKSVSSIVIAVDDTIAALGKLANFHRRRAAASIVAITGSNGKTTTKEMSRAILEQDFTTHATAGNLNNEIGLPLTLLKLTAAHRWAVVELGMNHPGEIQTLARICQPEVGVITNIGPAHIEGVGSIEGVMRAKGELLSELTAQHTAALNADDHRVLQLATTTAARKLLYGTSEQAEIRALRISIEKDGSTFVLSLPDGEIPVRLSAPGEFMVANALAASAVGHAAGMDKNAIKTGLENFRAVKGRMNILKTPQGFSIIDDTYNANPASMKSAIRTLISLKGDQRGFLVAGDMFELGEQAAAFHREVGKIAARAGIHRLYAAGALSEQIAEGARSEGMNSHQIHTGSHESILADIKKCIHSGDWILVKGSRMMQMETIVQGLQQENDAVPAGAANGR